MTKRAFKTLRGAMDADDYEWLQDTNPRLANALYDEVADGATSDDIERFIKDEYGTNREGLARRMKSAARHLQQQRQTASA
jgi:hypothetical protein